MSEASLEQGTTRTSVGGVIDRSQACDGDIATDGAAAANAFLKSLPPPANAFSMTSSWRRRIRSHWAPHQRPVTLLDQRPTETALVCRWRTSDSPEPT